MPGYLPDRRLCSSIAIKPYRLVSYWCVCAPIAPAWRPRPHLAGRARSRCGDGQLENGHLVPLPYQRCWAASSGGPRAPGDRHHPPRGPYLCPLSPSTGFGTGTMRGCGAQLVWLLVLSLAWLGPALGGKEEDGEVVAEEEEEEEDEVLSDELGEEDGVLVLHEHNFARALSEQRLLLVEFCKCPHCGQGYGQGHMWGWVLAETWGREYRQGVQARGVGVGRSRQMGTGAEWGPGWGG